jgi:tetratricopeptide (TPR) repeat protein
MKKQQATPSGQTASSNWVTWLLAATAVFLAGVIVWSFLPQATGPRPTPMAAKNAFIPQPYSMPEEKETFAKYSGSASCMECHPVEYAKWLASNHGMAERPLRDDLDRAGFDPAQSFMHGTQTSEARVESGRYQMVALGFGGKQDAYPIERVIGHHPLRQFLVSGTGGRLHTLEACWDPQKKEWFNVYGNEDRKPGEWGHWTGRGMVWNQMCASCHNTRARKNYNVNADAYRTTFAEMTVSCESCHGPMKSHTEWQHQYRGSGRKDPTVTKFTRDQIIETCAPCHTRRGELTGDFAPGDSFWDHYTPAIVDHTDIYFPDGQVRDENYEFGSFLGSRMYHAGVRCMDCHDPHAAMPILPGNQLCMRCHTAGGFPNAPPIMPEAHSFHAADSTGNQCVNCHMPQTVYMQRHWRHDHGFTIPDPLLTKEHGIPNACNRCHQDKDVDWALAATERWWGDKMNRRTRQRAQIMAKARQGDGAAVDGLLGVLAGDDVPYWKASAIQLLERWLNEERVVNAVSGQTHHDHPLVRASAARALEPVMSTARGSVEPLLNDPSRIVRNAAAWSLRDSLDLQSAAGKDLLHMLNLNADQPSGQMQLAQFEAARKNLPAAIKHMEKAIEWDPNSPPFHHDLAMIHSLAGNSARAVQKLQDAIRLNPREAEYHYKLALAYNETGEMEKVVAALREAVRVEPRHARAWYNLGLALNGQGKIAEAVAALGNGEIADPSDAGIPYALATILAQQGKRGDALAATERALRVRPGFPEAQQLRQMLGR